jgi:hypothetical protein
VEIGQVTCKEDENGYNARFRINRKSLHPAAGDDPSPKTVIENTEKKFYNPSLCNCVISVVAYEELSRIALIR